MRPNSLFIFLVLVLVCGTAHAVRAELRANLVLPGENRGWALVAVEFAPNAPLPQDVPLRVTMRDGRGGPALSVPLDAAEGRKRALVPMPWLAPADLEREAWPLDLTVLAGEARLESARVAVNTALPPGGPRVLVATGGDAGPWGHAPAIALPLDAASAATAPPALFLAADILVLPPALVRRLEAGRLQALLATGVRLAVRSDAPPETQAPLLAWERVHDGAAAWITPALPMPRPAAIEPGLAPIMAHALRRPLQPAGRAVLWAIFPATILLLLIARGLFRRRERVLLAALVGIGGVTAASIALLLAAGDPPPTTARWRITPSSTTRPLPRIDVEETLTLLAGRLQVQHTTPGEAGDLLVPVAASLPDYWAMHKVTWELDAPHLDVSLPPGLPLAAFSRTLTFGATLPPVPRDSPALQTFASTAGIPPGQARRMEGGYVEGPRQLFTAWAAETPAANASAEAWYALRFDARRRYLCWPGPEGAMGFLDLGPTEPPAP